VGVFFNGRCNFDYIQPFADVNELSQQQRQTGQGQIINGHNLKLV